MSVTTVEGEHVYGCDLCDSKSTNLYALDLHRKALSGPDDPEVDQPEEDVVVDVCHTCRREIRQSHINSRIQIDDKPDDDLPEDLDPNLLKH